MIRLVLGSFVAALAMFLIGFVVYGTPLMQVGFASAPEAVQLDIQTALKALPGSGAYVLPSPSTPALTAAFAAGPVAVIHYNASGFAAFDKAQMLTGYGHMLISATLLNLALWGIRGRIPDFAGRARLVIGMALAMVVFTNLSDPVWFHQDWRSAIFVATSNFVSLVVAGCILARWFVPAR